MHKKQNKSCLIPFNLKQRAYNRNCRILHYLQALPFKEESKNPCGFTSTSLATIIRFKSVTFIPLSSYHNTAQVKVKITWEAFLKIKIILRVSALSANISVNCRSDFILCSQKAVFKCINRLNQNRIGKGETFCILSKPVNKKRLKMG